MITRLLLCISIFTLFFSCSNNDSVTPTDQEANFYALTVGNSWVYKNYRYNMQSEIYEDTGVVDSISIVSTEDISGQTYFKFRRLTTGNEEGISLCNPNGEHFEFLREDNGNLVRDDGTLKFTNNDYSLRIISDNEWGDVVEQLIEGETTIMVEAGSFNCINSERYAILTGGTNSSGLDRFYYSEGVGLIYDTSSTITNNIPTIIRRLDSYSIQ
ncbi:hypothetical protein [uncultured Psychroserpens sp.]|uniref:hypothetical protein n=1 Tax=uncultured Psychroserpens sp. TaxID=255436 RepID=UPI0026203524|nr:hypothetical protein [uncultured Psychroserpens sp.]